MDYSKITLIKDRKRITREEMAELLGMSKYGYDKTIRNQTLTVKNLEKIAAFFQVPVGYFFDETDHNRHDPMIDSYTCKECSKYEGMIELLKEQLMNCERRIEQLSRELGAKTAEKNIKSA
jgi:transcriptional regulator with XRE-family HTH domain